MIYNQPSPSSSWSPPRYDLILDVAEALNSDTTNHRHHHDDHHLDMTLDVGEVLSNDIQPTIAIIIMITTSIWPYIRCCWSFKQWHNQPSPSSWWSPPQYDRRCLDVRQWYNQPSSSSWSLPQYDLILDVAEALNSDITNHCHHHHDHHLNMTLAVHLRRSVIQTNAACAMAGHVECGQT